MDHLTKKLRIVGVVQGVGFRYSMVSQAKALGLTGWVRNCRDGSVEAVVQGPEEAVKRIMEWAQNGPAGSHVEAMEVSDATGQFSEFQIDYTV